MISQAEGNLLTAEVDALVNTVNTVGVMGKGIALQFKRAFPENFHDYKKACSEGEMRTGTMHVHERSSLIGPRYIINFPTKRHWRSPSRLEDIEQGLQDLRRVVLDHEIRSIAVPPLGCGNGGLRWAEVRAAIVAALGDLPDVDVRVYPPEGAPPAEAMPNDQEPPALNRQRAAFLVALHRYIKRGLAGGHVLDAQVTLLEAHKIVYLLQRVGFGFEVSFGKGHYGPYSSELDNAISVLEGHFLSGFGDGTQGAGAHLTPCSDIVSQADGLLRSDSDFSAAMERFDQLTDGYEHPYGMELLGTLLFASESLAEGEVTFDAAADFVKQWTPRKEKLFSDAHLAAAWERLACCGMVAPAG